MFDGVGVARICREPDDLEGPDNYLISIPIGEGDLHERISEMTLLNPELDLAGWVLKRQRSSNYFGSMFDEPVSSTEGEFIRVDTSF
ncbi:hypothetical protein C8R44DRAFT_786449, partial [Mycena epipterygia]